MELFHEIYGNSFRAVEEILKEANKKALSKKEMIDLLQEKGLDNLFYFIISNLTTEKWNLLKKEKEKWKSKLNPVKELPLTKLQKRWLKSILEDERMGLFLESKEIESLKIQLKEEKGLFCIDDIWYFDQYEDGDNFKDELYQLHFRLVKQAIKEKTLLEIFFYNRRKKQCKGVFIPYHLEYSLKDNKLRIYAVRILNGSKDAMILNLSRIITIKKLENTYNLKKIPERKLCKEPIVFELSKERNSIERAMLHFANYEKKTEYEPNTEKYICSIYYNKNEETELLIRILSFEPMVKVLKPEHFLKQVKQRVHRQIELIENCNHHLYGEKEE